MLMKFIGPLHETVMHCLPWWVIKDVSIWVPRKYIQQVENLGYIYILRASLRKNCHQSWKYVDYWSFLSSKDACWVVRRMHLCTCDTTDDALWTTEIFWGKVVCDEYEDVRQLSCKSVYCHILLKIGDVGCDWCINFPSSISFDVWLRGLDALIFYRS